VIRIRLWQSERRHSRLITPRRRTAPPPVRSPNT
jgi:hypothetical protein